MATTKQVWECPTCKDRYRSPIVVMEVLCPKPHIGGAKTRQMKLIEEPSDAKR